MTRHLTYYLVALIIISSAISLHAQELLNDTLRMEEVKIKGLTRSGGVTVRRIDSLELWNNPGSSLADLLAEQTPVFIKSATPGSLATISMRGTMASHTRVIWNGLRLNSPMLGQADFSLIPTFFTDQVEITGGPGSLQKGSGGLGGTIDLNSRVRWGNPNYGNLSAQVGSFNTYRLMAEAGGGKNNWQLRIRLFHEQSKNDFSFLNTANGLFNIVKQQNADYKKNGLLAQSFYRPNEHHILSINVWIQDSDRNLPPIMSYEGSSREEYQLDKQLRLSAGWQYFAPKFSCKLNSGTALDQMDYYLANQTGGGLLVNYNTHSFSSSWYNNYEASLKLNPKHVLKTIINADYHQVEIQDQKSGSGYTAQRGEAGIQVRAEQSWSKSFSSYALLQQDWIKGKRNPLIPSIGASYELIPGLLEIKSSLGKNFHSPTLNDLYWVPGGNPDLLPEEGYLGDLGFHADILKDSLWSFETDLTLFTSYIENWILWQPGEFRYWTPENLASVWARGIESFLKINYSGEPFSFSFRSNYSFTHTNQVNSSAQLIYIPVHKLTGLFHLARDQWYLNYSYSFTSERLTSTHEEQSFHRLPAYSLHNITLGRSLLLRKTKTDLRLQMHNLFNADYQTILWRAMPRRYFTLSFKIYI
ncbi:MAG: TonB-dependent receptor plug domain-containing protein [Bacteroidales bacterium]|nr:TonB-dependent receptor plug domain-containing protein [Bacteroidales bacterium]